MKRRAIISVSDKTGIIDLAKRLSDLGIEIISTGGTAKVLVEAGIPVTGVSSITGFPECLDGRVKTLHPAVHAGILAVRNNAKHMNQINELGIQPIDFVVINLYPFKQTILKENVDLQEAIENIDIGGPTMLRAAAKNYQDVVVLVDPADYHQVLTELETNKQVSISTKFRLAAKVFEHTAHYDALIAEYAKEHKRIIFNGDGYSDEWVVEAEKRGLPNLKNMVDATEVLGEADVVALFNKYGVLTPTELKAREEVKYENYSKVINIEALTMIDMATKQIIPAVIKYTKSLADTVLAVKAAGCDADVQAGILAQVSDLLKEAKAALSELEKVAAEAAQQEEAQLRQSSEATIFLLCPAHFFRCICQSLANLTMLNRYPLLNLNRKPCLSTCAQAAQLPADHQPIHE